MKRSKPNEIFQPQPMNVGEARELLNWAGGLRPQLVVVVRAVNASIRTEDSEEVVQEALVDLWKTATSSEPVVYHWENWLRAVCRYKALALARSLSARGEVGYEQRQIEEFPDGDDYGLQEAQDRSAIGALSQLYVQLPSSDRELVRRRVEGETFFEIASQMNLTPASARQRGSRIFRRLRRQLNGQPHSGHSFGTSTTIEYATELPWQVL